MRAAQAVFAGALALGFAVAVTAACSKGSAGPQDRPAGPPAEPTVSAALKVTASAARATVELGAPIVVRLRLQNTGDAPEKANVPRLGRNSVTIRVRTEDGRTQWLDRLHADLSPTGQFEWKMPEATVIAPGKDLTTDVPVIACSAGKQTLIVQYKRAGADPVTTEPFDVEVVTEGNRKRLGAQLDTTLGTIVVALRPDLALNTVESFASLIAKGYYDGVMFHRIVAGFMAQGGDPEGTGGGGPGYFLPLEAHTKLLHDRGVLSMARTGVPDTAGSQFFLMFKRNSSLDPRGPGTGYTVFGEMVSGEETLGKLEAVRTRVDPQIVDQVRTRYPGQDVERIVDQLVASHQVEKSQPLERVAIEKATLVTLE